MKRHTAKVALFCLILSSACGEITPTSYNDPAVETFPVPTSKIATDFTKPADGLHKIPLADVVDTTVTGNTGWYWQILGIGIPSPRQVRWRGFLVCGSNRILALGERHMEFRHMAVVCRRCSWPETLTTLNLWPLPIPDGLISCGGMQCEMDGSWSTAHESTEIESYRWAIVGPDSVEIQAWTKSRQVTLFRIRCLGIEYNLCLTITDGHENENTRTIGQWTPGPARSSSGHSPGPPTPTQYTACDGDNVGDPGYTQAGTPGPNYHVEWLQNRGFVGQP